jgi:hypothetical protein
MKTQPQRGDRNSFPRDRKHWFGSQEIDKAPEHEADKPQSLEAAKVSVVGVLKSRCFHRFEICSVSFHQLGLPRTTDPAPALLRV